MINYQRKNSSSNASVGKKFELLVLEYFNKSHDFNLTENFKIEIGISSKMPKKAKAFDLGKKNEIVIECKSHSWTEGRNVPSAKLATWNEAMYLFSLVPKGMRKLFVVERFFSDKRGQTLAEYYLQVYAHLIPDDVEIWEFNVSQNTALQLN